MKLHSLRVENFRAIKDSIKLDFTDSLGKPRKVTLIVGPNGSGKTSILDAIQVVVKSLENPQNPELREGLEFSVLQLVHNSNSRIKRNAKIEFKFSLEKDESEAIGEIEDIITESGKKCSPPTSPMMVMLEYPRQQNGNNFWISSRQHLGARGYLTNILKRKITNKSMFERIGSVCYLDQRRSLMLVQNFNRNNADKLLHDDVLSWLREFYRKHLTWNEEKSGESYWKRVQRLFNKICYPTEIVDLESDEDKDTLILRKNGIEYDLLQMSSGEHQILRILVGLVSERAKNSIVLIDEVELHLHPSWQRKLIHALREDKESNNQYIFTTHSPFVKQLFYENEIIDLGDLGE